MSIELKHGVVELVDYDPEWEVVATETIQRLWRVFGSVAKDIQHIGSTKIRHIKAKPIIDIAIAVDNFAEVETLTPVLEKNGLMRCNWYDDTQMIFAVGEDVEPGNRITTYFIHIVKTGSPGWYEYINFRDYINAIPNIAKEYEAIKIRLAAEYPYDPGCEKYLAGKHDFIVSKIDESQIWTDFNREFIKIETITKGMSSDKKYYAETANGCRYLLRIADISEYDRKKVEYERMKLMDNIGVPMSRPVNFGVCNNSKNVYQLLSWCDGENLETMLSLFPETEQYMIGLKAGEILRKIHSVPVSVADTSIGNWNERYNNFIDESINSFRESGIQTNSSELLLKYFNDNRHLLIMRPSYYLHGDFHTGNMMYHDNNISVIDWEIHLFGCCGDPWWEVLYYYINPHYSSGVVHGYFDGEPPREFWELYSVYAAVSAISSIPWAFYCCPSELDLKIKNCSDIAEWFDKMRNTVPSWYLQDFYIQWTDGVPYKLKAPFDFSFLSKYGKIFKVFDNQDSGNICFGVTDGDKRYFIKFAGAPTEWACVNAAEAIANLKRTVPIYKDLAHPNLIKFIDAEEIGGGFAMLFEWVDAECMHPMYPLSHKKFMQIPLETRHQVFEDIFTFHAHIVKQGYVSIDFYDGSVMYDFGNRRTVICDIDFYSKAPYTNTMGRLWGSSRFMSPEEFQLGAVIDEITNVYTMGATAFALFGDVRDRCIGKWNLSKELFDVAKKAVSNERDERQQSIDQFMLEWRAAKI